MTSKPELFAGAFWADPYPAYASLRADGPVREVQTPDGRVWLITRYADVRAALVDPRLSKDWRHTLPPEQRAAAPSLGTPMMITMDAPDHTRLRTLVSRSFTARRMSELRPRVEQIAADLLDALPVAAGQRGGVVDLVAHYAFPLPVRVICELLGVPAQDRGDFSAWSATMVDDSPSDEKATAMGKLGGYLGGLIAAKRREPDGALLSALACVPRNSARLESRAG